MSSTEEDRGVATIKLLLRCYKYWKNSAFALADCIETYDCLRADEIRFQMSLENDQQQKEGSDILDRYVNDVLK